MSSSQVAEESPELSPEKEGQRLLGETRDDRVSSMEGFDLTTAVDLARCSFHSYSKPEANHAIKIFTSKRVEVTYFDREWLETNFDGVLEIEVKRGADLPKTDPFGKTDAYVRLSLTQHSLGQSKAQTKTVAGSLNPIWNEKFSFPVRNAQEDILTVQVRDDDPLLWEDTLGFATFPVKDFQSRDVVDVEANLEGGGTLHMSGKFITFKEAALEPTQDVELSDKGAIRDRSFTPKTWKELAILSGEKTKKFVPLFYIENPRTDTQVWVYKNEYPGEDKEVVVAFRGTEFNKRWDRFTDIKMLPTPLITDCPQVVNNLIKDNEKVNVHLGFQRSYVSVKKALLTAMSRIHGIDDTWTVFVTGHSLGAALATLCAFDMATRRDFLPQIEMYNFGSPRVGNLTFARAFKTAVPKSWRIANRGDIVTTVPKTLHYKHVNTQVNLDRHGNLEAWTGETGAGVGRLRGLLRSLTLVIRVPASYVVQLCRGGVGTHMNDAYFRRFHRNIKRSISLTAVGDRPTQSNA